MTTFLVFYLQLLFELTGNRRWNRGSSEEAKFGQSRIFKVKKNVLTPNLLYAYKNETNTHHRTIVRNKKYVLRQPNLLKIHVLNFDDSER